MLAMAWGCTPAPAADAQTATLQCTAPTTWTTVSTRGAPQKEPGLAFWSGSELWLFDTNGGAAFNPCQNSWRPASIRGAPRPLLENWRHLHQPPIVHGDRVVFVGYG